MRLCTSLGTFAILSLVPAADLDPQSGVFHAITVGSIALRVGFLGMLAAILVTVGNAGGVGSTVAGIARVPFVVGIDRYLPAAFGKIHPRWKTPYVSILVQAISFRCDSAGEPDQRDHARRLSIPD